MKYFVMICYFFDFVEEIVILFFENKIGCFFVIKVGKLVGIIFEFIVLYMLVKLIGVY